MWRALIPGVCAAASLFIAEGGFGQVSPDWDGQGRYRMLIEVDPINLGIRPSDERPAELNVNLQAAMQALYGVNEPVDMTSVQVMRYDPTTGQTFNDGNWAYGQTTADRPFRWYDDTIPYEFPEVEGYLNSTPNGTLTWNDKTRWGYFFDSEGDWKSGRMVWNHTQQGNNASHYAVYFDTLPTGQEPWRASPRGWVGDGGFRARPDGIYTTGTLATRIDVTDWDGDGLLDILAGNQRGSMAWYKNLGTAESPEYGTSKLLYTTDLKPIDVGWNATPKVVDWDGDGRDDIISGGQHNRIVWYRNVGSNTNRLFQYQGVLLNSDGQVLELPNTPNPERPSITIDYYPTLEVVDYDNDGNDDLVASGYITGMPFVYRNIGTNPDGTPKLQYNGPVFTTTGVLDTEWAAAPTFADFTGDGLLDIMTGTFHIDTGVTAQNHLEYYVNIGTANQPYYDKRPLPIMGLAPPAAALATPRAVDFNDDGLLDLIVSTDTQMYQYENVGTATDPIWKIPASSMPSEWTSNPLFATQYLDWNNDGLPDKFQDLNVSLNLGGGTPGLFGTSTSVLQGQSIPPKPGDGDGWQWLRVFDLDWNGELDVIDADHDGKIWLHRNSGTNNNPFFDTTGLIFMQTDGNPIDVGPGPGDPPFDQLQGSRAKYAISDINENGRPDIVIVNFAGEVTYYENEMALPTDDPLFTLPSLVANLPTRGVPFITDWDNDGLLDIVASDSPDRMMFIRNLGNDGGGHATFAPGVWVDLVEAPYGSIGLLITDFNGDGDDDVIIDTTYRFTTFTEGSFLENDYANATLLGFEEMLSLLPGDANNDGQVTGADLIAVQQNFGNIGPADGTLLGDANDDGQVTGADLVSVQQNFGNTLSAAPGALTPEPGSLIVFVMSTLIVVSRKGRGRNA